MTSCKHLPLCTSSYKHLKNTLLSLVVKNNLVITSAVYDAISSKTLRIINYDIISLTSVVIINCSDQTWGQKNYTFVFENI